MKFNRKALGTAAATLALGACGAFGVAGAQAAPDGIAPPENITCGNSTVEGAIVESITVPPGQYCKVFIAGVLGNVYVGKGAGLYIDYSTIGGNLTAASPLQIVTGPPSDSFSPLAKTVTSTLPTTDPYCTFTGSGGSPSQCGNVSVGGDVSVNAAGTPGTLQTPVVNGPQSGLCGLSVYHDMTITNSLGDMLVGDPAEHVTGSTSGSCRSNAVGHSLRAYSNHGVLDIGDNNIENDLVAMDNNGASVDISDNAVRYNANCQRNTAQTHDGTEDHANVVGGTDTCEPKP